MIAAVAVGVGIDFYPGFHTAGLFPIGFAFLVVIVGINKILAGVVRRVDLDALDRTTVSGQQAFKAFQIFAFDDQVAVCLVGID